MFLWILLSLIITSTLGEGLTRDNFKLVDKNGNAVGDGEKGLLLFKGGTVCDDHFNYNAAHAICREMGYNNALNWEGDEGSTFDLQESLDIKLGDVSCSTEHVSSCSFKSESLKCYHWEDVFLTCTAVINVRDKLIDEISPASAEHSTQDDKEEHGAKNAIDRDMDSYANTQPDSDGTSWLTINLGQTHRVSKIVWYNSEGNPHLTWTCTDTGHLTCEGDSCSDTTVIVSTEGWTPDCGYADTVKLQRNDGGSFSVREIAIAGEQVREREPDEIIPVSAEHSRSTEDAANLIDGDLETGAMIEPGPDGTGWLKLHLDQVYCVTNVIWYRFNGNPYITWTCSNSDCSTCKGFWGFWCSGYTLTVSAERTTLDNLPSVTDCRYGDTVKLQINGNYIFVVDEIAAVGKKSL